MEPSLFQFAKTAVRSDVPESFLSSQSHKPFESESWFGRVRVESQKLSSHFESLVCKLDSMSSHMKFHIFLWHFLCYGMPLDKLENGAQHAIKHRPIG